MAKIERELDSRDDLLVIITTFGRDVTYEGRVVEEVDENGASVVWNNIQDRLYPLCDRIAAITRHS